MITKFELSPLQVKEIIAWKELHMKECPGILHKFHINFSDETSDCASVRCLQCNKGRNIYDYDAYDQEQKDRYFTEPQFTETIFMGNGSHSVLKIDRLHARLEYAVSMLCGQQQNGGMGTEYSIEQEQESEKAILEVIQDIAMALGVADKVKYETILGKNQ